MFFEITVKGAVQGVGFRPYIHALAVKQNMEGCVYNEAGIVKIFIRAGKEAARLFIEAIKREAPEGAEIASIECREADVDTIADVIYGGGGTHRDTLGEKGFFEGFRILKSPQNRAMPEGELPVILPDIGICDSCLKEMLDPKNRRYRYPLISCTSCGPRYSIIRALPYDRERMTMAAFEMCPECREEYEGRKRPVNSALRHHAQTISCHSCGPQYVFKTAAGVSSPESAFGKAAEALSAGEVVGLKGTGGYQLLADPFSDKAVRRLREIKGREKKPFAVMFSRVEDILEYASVSVGEESALKSPARPIVLLEKKSRPERKAIAPEVKDFSPETASESLYVGAFLPSIGMHRLLCDELGPLIVTSANVSGEPIIISDETFCESFLDGIAGVLTHEREILSPADDSVVYNLKETRSMQYIRRARGYAPLAVTRVTERRDDTAAAADVVYIKQKQIPREKRQASRESSVSGTDDILSFGSDLKAAFCLKRGETAVVSQYFGDLENYETFGNYQRELQRAEALFGFKPVLTVCDKHPLYLSSQAAESYAKRHELPCIKVQHHHAHAASVMAEKGWNRAIGVVFDGTGYGEDGKLWGGEFLFCENAGFRRLGQLKYLTLCGGDAVSADAGLCARCYLEAGGLGGLYEGEEAGVVRAALKKGINTIESSSMGRLFDAVAFILGIRKRNSYEGECAAALENAAAKFIHNTELSVDVIDAYRNGRYSIDGVDIRAKNVNEVLEIPVFTGLDGVLQADQVKLFEELLCRHNAGNNSHVMQTTLAFEFHLAIIDMVKKICVNIRDKTGESRVALSGGCFVNRLLLSGCVATLRSMDFDVAWNMKVPLGDGGISLGQAYIAGLGTVAE